MKIKKISILGFKSFMDRLEVNFPTGISGVVGPNGCGKSNLVDAIRWCMGEQSPKQLRGRNMEDVIFSGAGKMQPLGMAEVSIVFANGDGSFPPAYSERSELSITRRLFRSGESEYRINNVPCRLKDLQEIFMDTGLGNKAYSIIGQGKIGAILEQKPEETRTMIEEAAGITKYRKKVEASQKKIELTQANLQRVQDILGEVERQMRSLKRQAAKARRYKALSEDIQGLELVLFANTYHEYAQEALRRQQSTEELVQEEVGKTAEFSQMQARIECMSLELEEKDKALDDAKKAYFSLKETFHRKEAALESLAGEMAMLDRNESRLSQEQEDIHSRLQGLQQEMVEIRDRILGLKESAQGVEAEAGLSAKRLHTKRAFVQQIKEDYEKARAEVQAGVTHEVGLSHESGYLSKMIGQVTDTRSRLEKEQGEVSARLEQLKKASERKTLLRETTSEKLLQIERDMGVISEVCSGLEEGVDQIASELRNAESQMNACQTRLGSLKALLDNYEGYEKGVRAIMKAEDLKPRQEGRILGLVADLVQVDPKYDQALENVLAEKLQYIIVESQDDGMLGVRYLKFKEKGKGSFIPLHELKSLSCGNGKENRFPLLRDLVSVPDRFKEMVWSLLGNTRVVQTLDQALSAWRENGSDTCYVTPEGDMVDARGVISGGKVAPGFRSILSRKREIAELTAEAVRREKAVAELQARAERLRLELADKRRDADALQDERWKCQDELNDLDKAIFRLSQEMDQLTRLSRKISEDILRFGKEHQHHQEQLSRIQEEILRSQQRREQVETLFKAKEEELKASEEELDAIREELAKLKTREGILQEEQRGLSREMERVEAYTKESHARLQKIQEDIAHARVKRIEIQEKSVLMREELKRFSKRLEEAEGAVNRADHARQAFHQTIKEEETRAESFRAGIDALRERIGRARMEQSEIRFKLDGLSETVREKYALELPAVFEQYVSPDFSAVEVREKVERKKTLRQRLGEVNLTAIKEHEALKERYQFITAQRQDLIDSIESLEAVIQKINKTSLERFMETLEQTNSKLKEVFPILFNGGTAGLKLLDETKPLESGILVEVQPPGKKLSHMGLLSGGEKALVAMALLFAIYMIKPSPFCLLDEVDAPLDEANIDRFNNLLKEIRPSSQIIMVTHNKKSMEIADRLIGVTMEKAGISKIVSVDIHPSMQ
jgi:chromosome segregation protein